MASSRRPNSSGGGGGGDVYRQLIDSNDLVRELDDIEAISQQISQHAEVLYQNWKQQNPNQQQQQPMTPPPSAHHSQESRHGLKLRRGRRASYVRFATGLFLSLAGIYSVSATTIAIPECEKQV